MSNLIPNYLVRYCIEDNNPFISLNELPFDQANRIKKRHCEKYSIGGFYKEPEYLVQRKEIEDWMFSQFIRKGGRPKDKTPVYMFLGNGPIGEYDIRTDIQKGAMGYKIFIHQLSIDTVSFCYPDSMYEMEYDENGIPYDGHRTNTPEVLLYSDLEEYIKKNNVDKNPKFCIEAQVWDKERLNSIWEKKEYILVT